MGPEAVEAANHRRIQEILSSIPSSDSVPAPLQKLQKTYESMCATASAHGGLSNSWSIELFSKEVVRAMEEFIISKASPEALMQDASIQEKKASLEGSLSTLNIRYPKLRAPAFQSCIEDVLFYSKSFFYEYKMDSIVYLAKIGEVIKSFNEHAQEIQSK